MTALVGATTRRTADSNPEGPGSHDDSEGWVRNSKLAIACFALFALFWVAQAITGWQDFNADRATHHEAEVSLGKYLTTGAFAEATFENWESEFLQMGAFVLLTVLLVQKGSAESKKPRKDRSDEDPSAKHDDPSAPWPVRRGGMWLRVYENSLLLAFLLLFLGSIVGHAIGGAAEYNADREAHGESPPLSTVEYAQTSHFWFESFQNWQSEFLAMGTIVVLTIFLRQRGSPESKPVASPNDQTGSS